MTPKPAPRPDPQESLYQLRRERLQLLRTEYPTLIAMARELDMNVGYLRRLMQETRDEQQRNIGEPTAREIEARAGKPEFWLDDDAGRAQITRELWPFGLVPREAWESLTKVEQRAIQPAILALLKGVAAMRREGPDEE